MAALTLAVPLPAVSAHAQAPRTFVSAAGTDNSTCSFAAPCRHFQNAVNATSAGGEIDALDPAGYGPITITQAITIEGQGWSYIAPPASADAIHVNIVSGNVTIRGVSLNGVGITGTTIGIVFNGGGNLSVQNCVISNFSGPGIKFAPNASSQISVSNTKVSDNRAGIEISALGTGATIGVLNHVDVENNTLDGITLTTTDQLLNVNIDGSVSADNGGAGIIADGIDFPGTNVYVRNANVYNNAGTGLSANGNASIVVSRSMIVQNRLDFTGAVSSSGDNSFLGNLPSGGTLGKVNYQ